MTLFRWGLCVERMQTRGRGEVTMHPLIAGWKGGWRQGLQKELSSAALVSKLMWLRYRQKLVVWPVEDSVKRVD